MSTPFFSIIIPVYNGLSHDMQACLNSIWQQPLDAELYELICVDDCSTDGTREWLRGLAAEGRLRLLENETNIRQGGARNRGVREARGRYIVFIDSDDYFHHDGLARLYEALRDADLDVFVSDSSWQYRSHVNNNLQLNLQHREMMTGEEFLLRNGLMIAPWRLAIRRDFYLEKGLWFVENNRVEDVDWGATVHYHAQRMQYQPILLVHYIKGDSGTSDNIYRDASTLRDLAEAGTRTLRLTQTLYADSPAQASLRGVAQHYYHTTCRYLLCSAWPLGVKRGIISQIQVSSSPYLLVRLAISHPTAYSIIGNCAAPLARLVRTIHRWRAARRWR